MEQVTHTSKHFEQSVVLLRQEVSRYIERGICIVDNNYAPESVLNSSNLVHTLCKEIAKTRKLPFVSVLFYGGAVNGNQIARATIPNLKRCKPLVTQAVMIGRPFERRTYTGYPVSIDMKSTSVDVYYTGERGMEAFKSWLQMCETDSVMRFALGLPPKVSRSQR